VDYAPPVASYAQLLPPGLPTAAPTLLQAHSNSLVRLPEPENNVDLTRDQHAPVRVAPPEPAPTEQPTVAGDQPPPATSGGISPEAQARVYAWLSANCLPGMEASARDIGRQMIERWQRGKFMSLPSSWQPTLKRMLAETKVLRGVDVAAVPEQPDEIGVEEDYDDDVGIL
jgi:hypothetical protein